MVLIFEFIYLYSIISVEHLIMDQFFTDDIELSSLTTYMADESRDNLNHAITILLNWRYAILTHMSVTVVAPTCQ
jgi:hypothetical protein